jgi:hypothetical protein
MPAVMIFLVLGIAALALAIATFTGTAWLMNLRRQINDIVWTGRQPDDARLGRKARLGG